MGVGVLVRLMGAGPLEVGVVALVMLVDLMGVLVVAVVVMGLMQALLELVVGLLGLVLVPVGLWLASFFAPTWVLVVVVVGVGAVHH